MNFILITGNPRKGFKYIGPFKTETELVEYASYEMGLDIDWWVGTLTEPVSRKEAELARDIISFMTNKIIKYKDGNPRNYDIDNLELVDRNSLPGIDQHDILDQDKQDRYDASDQLGT